MRERVPAALIAYLGPMIDDPLAARIAFVEIMGASPRLEERRLEFREALVRLVETEGSAAVDRGEITPRDFRFAALALTGAANAIIYDWARTPDGHTVEDLEHSSGGTRCHAARRLTESPTRRSRQPYPEIMDFGETDYAHAGDVDIAYRVFGDGPMNIVIVPGIFSHLDLFFTFDMYCDFMARFGRFGRVVTFDKRGTGLSDPTPGAAELDERMDDIRAVMDATGMEHAAVIGVSEGGSLALLFAATYPDRTDAVVVCGSFGFVPPASELDLARKWRCALGHRDGLDRTFSRSAQVEPAHPPVTRIPRAGIGQPAHGPVDRRVRVVPRHPPDSFRRPSPDARRPSLGRGHPRRVRRELVEGVPDGRLVVLEGDDHLPWVGNTSEYVDVIEEFLTGTKHEVEPERGLSTVLFTDIVSSTSRNAEIGDDAWRRLLDRHNELIREALTDHRGREIKTIGDGSCPRSTAPLGRSAARRRSSMASRISASRSGPGCTPARWSCIRTVTSEAWP